MPFWKLDSSTLKKMIMEAVIGTGLVFMLVYLKPMHENAVLFGTPFFPITLVLAVAVIVGWGVIPSTLRAEHKKAVLILNFIQEAGPVQFEEIEAHLKKVGDPAIFRHEALVVGTFQDKGMVEKKVRTPPAEWGGSKKAFFIITDTGRAWLTSQEE